MKIIAAIKANAYGHGIVESARVLHAEGVYAVATGSFQNARAIREAGVDVRIQLFPGMLPDAAAEVLHYDLIPSVYNLETAEAVSKAASRPTPVFIKVDAGLARLGVALEEAEHFVMQVAGLPNLYIEGIFTHLPFNDAAGRDWAVPRSRQFDDLVLRLKRAGIQIPIVQSVASAGVACGQRTACNTVCIGHLLYGGLSRVTSDLGDLSSFRPVLKSIKARLVHVRRHAIRTSMGMGGKQSLPAGSTTGVIPIGLYNGYRPAAPGKMAMALVRGRRVPVLNVSLEYTTLDLTLVGDPMLGEEVIVLGECNSERISIEELALWLGTTPLGILMAFDERLPCAYSD
jgi:alanine racemase